MKMYSLTGKNPFIFKEKGEFSDLAGILPPIFKCNKTHPPLKELYLSLLLIAFSASNKIVMSSIGGLCRPARTSR